MQISAPPGPAYPSYRLITALRLYHVLPPQGKAIPPGLTETLLDEWRNTTLGKQDIISDDNERLCRECLLRICEEIMEGASKGLSKIKRVKEGYSNRLESVKCFIESLWEEESYIAKEVMRGLLVTTNP